MLSQSNLDRLLTLIPRNQVYVSPIKNLVIQHSDMPFTYEGTMQEPSICIVLNGERTVQLGEQCYCFNPDYFMFCPVKIPIRGEIKQASPDNPFVVISMQLDLAIISKILLENATRFTPKTADDYAFNRWRLSETLDNAFERLLFLHETPEDIPFLAPLIQQEIYYRLLCGKQGEQLKQMVSFGSHTQQIAKATDYLQQHFNQKISVDYLAQLCGMSVSGFHHYFKKMTTLSPLQYQKSLRLTTARKQIKQGERTIAAIAYQVSYESPSQFSREYRRYFGCSPTDDFKENE